MHNIQTRIKANPCDIGWNNYLDGIELTTKEKDFMFLLEDKKISSDGIRLLTRFYRIFHNY